MMVRAGVDGKCVSIHGRANGIRHRTIFTYLFIYALPRFIVELTHQAVPKDRAFYKTLLLRQAWLPQGHCRLVPCKKVKRYKKKPVSIVLEGVNTANKLRTYLLPLAMASFRVGCCVESLARQLCHCARAPLHLRALQSFETPSQPPPLSSTRTPSRSALTTTHRDAWPTPPTCSRTLYSSQNTRKWMA
jgi:hypothetical protein